MKHHTKKQAHTEFSEWAETYDNHWLNHVLFEPSHGMLLKELKGLPVGRSLDIGCGTGELATRLARRGWQTIGLDLCEPMLHRAKRKLNGEAARVRLTVGDSEHLPFAGGTFGAITCANSFHHYPHQEAVLREMRRVLAPGGKLFLADGWPDHFLGRIIYDLVITRAEGGNVRHCESNEIRAMFGRVGFKEVVQKRIHSPFPILLTIGSAPGA